MNPSLALLIFSLGTKPVPASLPSSSSEEAPAVEQIGLEVDHRALLEWQAADMAKKHAHYVLEDATEFLQKKHRVEIVDDESAPAIVVRLSWKDHQNSVYRVEIATRRDARPERMVKAFEVTRINSRTFSSAVLEQLPAALEQLRDDDGAPATVTPAPEEAVATVAAAPPAEPVAHDEEPMPSPHRRVGPFGALGIAGIVVGAGGLGVTSWGAVRMARGRSQTIDPMREQEGFLEGSGRLAGVTLLGAGLGLTAAGITMLVVDLTVLRKRSMAVAPIVGAQTAGATLSFAF